MRRGGGPPLSAGVNNGEATARCWGHLCRSPFAVGREAGEGLGQAPGPGWQEGLGHGQENGGSKVSPHSAGQKAQLPHCWGKEGALSWAAESLSGHCPQPREPSGRQGVAGGHPSWPLSKPPGVSPVLWGSGRSLGGPLPRAHWWGAQPLGPFHEGGSRPLTALRTCSRIKARVVTAAACPERWALGVH